MSREKHPPVTIDAAAGKPDPTPPKIKLSNIEDVRSKMAKIYEARSGKLDISDAGRLAYVLTGIGKPIEVEVIEKRLIDLERKMLN
ncbi:MAG: hypothetical protein IPJ48_14870 [Propionivibrio sp.]|uniref:Uncharacterized protein n=1 Tax=Candidatus Propionivibrio dominans TaxID=2954373 RepID=A0A9D7FGA7_9RHOO|nr:hypothetical protein [Candidatus Propionivibrio dominans]